MLDFIRIACAVPSVRVGDVKKNAEDICGYIEKADREAVDLLLFPELALTGYTCGDLFFQDSLWKAVKAGMCRIAFASGQHPNLTVVVGLPVRIGAGLYNCAAVFSRGEVNGLVPKTWMAGEEARWFASSDCLKENWLAPETIGLVSSEDYYGFPVGANQLFRLGDDALLGVEICQDGLVPQPRCGELASNGAEVIVNLSASPELAGKRSFRQAHVKHQSGLCSCIYAYTSAGCTESTSDVVYSGHSLIAENGKLLGENSPGPSMGNLLIRDCDLGRVRAQRRRNPYFRESKGTFEIRDVFGDTLRSDGSAWPVRKLPFVPEGEEAMKERCLEIFKIQTAGLKQRLAVIGSNPVIGVSGGMDSTLALLVAVEAMRQLGRPASDVYGVTMPCFGTSQRTHSNSLALMQALGITAKEIRIRDAVLQHFHDVGHDPAIRNGTYENTQARERTQVLMDYAGMVNGIVVGTGDLSELALGWCTYNGDHMSMYGVNATVPKTLIPRIIETVAGMPEFAAAREILMDILATPISPELLPPDTEGKISQQTEDLVGPYALHDFFLYHMLKFGFSPTKIYTLACRAFREEYEPNVIKKWMRVFYRRFFTQQFKRNCLPDGVKVGSIALGPRGDWRMPSDAVARVWLEEIEGL